MSFGASLAQIGRGLVYVTAVAVSIGVIWGVAYTGRVLGGADEGLHFVLGVCVWCVVVGAGVVLQLRRRANTSPNSMLFLTLFVMVLGTVFGVIANIATQPPIQKSEPITDSKKPELSF